MYAEIIIAFTMYHWQWLKKCYIIQLNNFSKQNFWIDTDKLSSNHSWTSSGLRTTPGASTYIVAKGYAVHSLMEWLLWD